MTTWPAFPLYEFQEEDITRFEDQRSVLLAWEMGTGKSPAALERDRRIRLEHNLGGKTLLVAPAGTHARWRRWFEENTPLTVTTIDPKNRNKFLRTPAHVYIMHPEAVRLIPSLRDVHWQHVILDEAHKIKSKDAKVTTNLKKIKPDFKTGLTGTPATSRPQDIWSILNWLYPRIWTSFNRFLDDFVEYDTERRELPNGSSIEYKVFAGPKNEDELLRRIAPYYSRHLKKGQCCPHHPDGVMPWLPQKTYDQIVVQLRPEQRRAYDQMARDMLAWVGQHEGEPIAAPMVISQLARLQQFALAYLDVEYADDGTPIYRMTEPSAKFDAVMELMANNPEEQFLIYSQWKQPLYLLGKRLEKANITHAFYTGDVSKPNREVNKRAFLDGKAQHLLGVIAAGGTGIDDLQMVCKTVIFLDRTWSPAENLQAEDRLHRDGQRDIVQVVDIVAANTVDLGKDQKLTLKWDWLRRLFGDTKVHIEGA